MKRDSGSDRSLMGISAKDLSRLSKATTPKPTKRAAPKKRASKAAPKSTRAALDFMATGLLGPNGGRR